MAFFLAASLLSLLSQQSLATPVRVLDTDFPDPSLIHTDDGYYSFATAGNGVHVQVATSPDFKSWKRLDGYDPVPGPFPDWIADNPQIWAPDVIKRDDGEYVMYMSASTSKDNKKHCIGTATSSFIKGPYKPQNKPLACPLKRGGAIDPAGFQDEDGTRYVVYKIDGKKSNSPTPIMLQRVASDGITPQGKPTKLLEKDEQDGPLIEAPSLVKSGDKYYLTFSSNMYSSKKYDVRYATASKVTGPYTKESTPLLKTGHESDVGPLVAPGGSDFSEDGSKIVFHAFKNGKNVTDGRAMYTSEINLLKGVITFDK